jgi:hypothetical protein
MTLRITVMVMRHPGIFGWDDVIGSGFVLGLQYLYLIHKVCYSRQVFDPGAKSLGS